MMEVPSQFVETALRVNCCAALVDGEWRMLTQKGLSMVRSGFLLTGCKIGIVIKPRNWPPLGSIIKADDGRTNCVWMG